MADKKQQQILAELAQAFAGDTGQEVGSAAKPADENLNSRVIVIENVDDFEAIVKAYGSALIVIDFTAKWYNPSQHFLTQFVAMAEIYKGAAFCLVDIDVVKPVAESLGVNAPMFRLYRGGKQVAELSGLNVLGNMGELQTVLKYEIEAAGAKESDAPLPSIIPESSGNSDASSQGSAPTLKLMKTPQGEGAQQQAPETSAWGAATVEEPPTKQVKLYQFFPHTEYLYWQSASYQNILKKLFEFNDSGSAAFTMTPQEKDSVAKVFGILEQESRYHSTTFDQQQFDILQKLALQWHPKQLLPVLDIIRVLALHPHAADNFLAGIDRSRKPNTTVDQLVTAHLRADAEYANQLMTLRLLANLFRFHASRNKILMLSSNSSIGFMALLENLTASTNKNIQTALATVLLNLVVLHTQNQGSLDDGSLQRTANVLAKMLSVEQNDDSFFRVVIGLGTAALREKDIKAQLNTIFSSDNDAQLLANPALTDKSKSSMEEFRKILNA